MTIQPTTWSCVDGLGRVLSTEREVHKGKRKDRFVAIFFWPCHGYWPKIRYAFNITERIESVDAATLAEAKNDYDHELWRTPDAELDSWYWDQSVYGYYDAFDPYVIRKQAELLADADVDLILFDCCVGLKTTQAYHAVFKGFSEARRDGVNAPKVSFILPMGNPGMCRPMLMQLYDEIYSKGLYEDCWFYFENEKGESKPLIFAWNDALDRNNEYEATVSNFFTYRRPDAYSWRHGDEWDIIDAPMDEALRDELSHNGTPDLVGTKEKTLWGWLNTFPQPKYYYMDGDRLILDNMPVGVAQNVDTVRYQPTAMNGTNVAGRSYVYGEYGYTYETEGRTVSVTPDMEHSVYYGLNFQQQWDYAIEADPTFIFVTGWNEWTVGRYRDFCGTSNGFPDQFSKECSRDCEPSAGELKDYYYYQLVENIRRFKGVEKAAQAPTPKAIDIHGDLSQWDDIPVYGHYVGSTKKRCHSGCIGILYENDTMRNDIRAAKVTYDADTVYFMVETADTLTPATDPAWMRLYISTDLTRTTPNWEGFNFVVNRESPSATACVLERATTNEKGSAGWQWERIGEVDYAVSGNILQIAIPRVLLGLTGETIDLHFKWSDNMQTDGDIMDFYVNGDVAPGGRFMFRFRTSPEQ